MTRTTEVVLKNMWIGSECKVSFVALNQCLKEHSEYCTSKFILFGLDNFMFYICVGKKSYNLRSCCIGQHLKAWLSTKQELKSNWRNYTSGQILVIIHRTSFLFSCLYSDQDCQSVKNNFYVLCDRSLKASLLMRHGKSIQAHMIVFVNSV